MSGGTSTVVGGVSGSVQTTNAAMSTMASSVSASGTATAAADVSLFPVSSDARITPALACRYQLQQLYRTDEFDDGFVDLAIVKDFTVGTGHPADVVALTLPSVTGQQATRGGRQNASTSSGSGTGGAATGSGIQTSSYVAQSISRSSNCLSLLFGIGMADNRTVEFVAPVNSARIWQRGLSRLLAAGSNSGTVVRGRWWRRRGDVDLRINWLQEQYLQLYFESGRCHGPTAAEAIRVC